MKKSLLLTTMFMVSVACHAQAGWSSTPCDDEKIQEQAINKLTGLDGYNPTFKTTGYKEFQKLPPSVFRAGMATGDVFSQIIFEGWVAQQSYITNLQWITVGDDRYKYECIVHISYDGEKLNTINRYVSYVGLMQNTELARSVDLSRMPGSPVSPAQTLAIMDRSILIKLTRAYSNCTVREIAFNVSKKDNVIFGWPDIKAIYDLACIKQQSVE